MAQRDYIIMCRCCKGCHKNSYLVGIHKYSSSDIANVLSTFRLPCPHQLMNNHRLMSYLANFCINCKGVTESNQNEDISLGHDDGASFNLDFHFDKDHADLGDSYCIQFQELIVTRQQLKAVFEKQGNVANTIVEKQLRKLYARTKFILRNKNRKEMCDMKYCMESCRYRNFVILFQLYFKNKNIVGQKCHWSGEILWNNFEENNTETISPICEMINNSRTVDRMSEQIVQDGIKETNSFDSNCESNRNFPPQDCSPRKLKTICDDGLEGDLSLHNSSIIEREAVCDDGSNKELPPHNSSIIEREAVCDDGPNRELPPHNSLIIEREAVCDEGSNRELPPHNSLIIEREAVCDDGPNRELPPHNSSIIKHEAVCDDGSNRELPPHNSSIIEREAVCDDGPNKELPPHNSSIIKFKAVCNDGSERYLIPRSRSKAPLKIKVPINNIDSLLNMKNVDLTTSLMEKGNINFDLQKDFGFRSKDLFRGHIFWQDAVILAYPFTQHNPETNTSQDDSHNFMRYEVFRLCSFSYTRFPADFDVWVTQLAQAGFYCVNENGRIVCFACGQEFQGAVNSPIENAHRSGCRHNQRSRPLHTWTEGLSRERMAIYYNRYGNLRPYTFDASGHAAMTLESVDHTSDGRNVADSNLESQSQQNNEYVSVDPLVRGADVLPGAMSDAENPVFGGEIRPQYHSESVPNLNNETSRNDPFGSQRHSLPSNLNVVSGAVVSEESQDLSGSHSVLTSAARNPVSVHNVPSRRNNSQDAQGGSENGAVGGADPALDLSKASYPLFSSPAARRQSFTAWEPTHSHRPDDLAAAGFFYAGYADCVRCFYCGLGLKFWREVDIPAYQHARYRPNCVYNRMYKGQDYIDRVQQDIRNEQGAAANDGSQPPTDQSDATAAPPLADTEILSVVRVTPATVGPQIHLLMDSPVAQTAMLNGWQRYQVQRAVEQIVQELGENNLEISILLDVLMNLYTEPPDFNNLLSGNSTNSDDSGITDSRTDATSCAASVRAPATENQNMDDPGLGAEAMGGVQIQHRATASAQQPALSNPEFAEVIASVEREHALLSDRLTCRICRVKPVCCIFLPCGHIISCQECADGATHCIMCGKQIVATASVFLA